MRTVNRMSHDARARLLEALLRRRQREQVRAYVMQRIIDMRGGAA